MTARIRRLGPSDCDRIQELNALFAATFDDSETYSAAPPSEAYLRSLLERQQIIVLAALGEDVIVGGLIAYVLDKLEQERSEIYIYDLAVSQAHRRGGLATALIGELQALAAKIGAWVIYVQADYGDDPAIALYEKLGAREDVMHFDIAPRTTRLRP